MKKAFLPLFLLGSVSLAIANTAPTVIIQSAEMRPGTTLMDVVYRVNDPDDATVKTRALAFVDGVRSFANVIRPVTFVEGTAANLGDAIPANVDHTLTWDVAADWDVDLGQVKFEVLAMDGRGLLPFDWITIPAAGESSELTISKNSPSDQEVLDALMWLYAAGDEQFTLSEGVVKINANGGFFRDAPLAVGDSVTNFSTYYLLSRMNLSYSTDLEIAYADSARSGIVHETHRVHAVDRPWFNGPENAIRSVAWGRNNSGQTNIPAGLNSIKEFACGSNYTVALQEDGTVVAWGGNASGQIDVPVGLTDIIAISAGSNHTLALKNDGTVIAWGGNGTGQCDVPSGLADVTAIAAGLTFSVAARSDGTVVHWGSNYYGEGNVPANLSDVIALTAGNGHIVALKSDGTLVAWGRNNNGSTNVPVGLTNVTSVASGYYHVVALKDDGTVVAWGNNSSGETNVPDGLSHVIDIAAGANFSLALTSYGSIVAWGTNNSGEIGVPYNSDSFFLPPFAAGGSHSIAAKFFLTTP